MRRRTALAGLPQRDRVRRPTLAVPSDFVNRWPRPTASWRQPGQARRRSSHRVLNPDRTLFYFNMEDPLVGGFAPERWRCAVPSRPTTDIDREIRLLRRGQAVPAQSPWRPTPGATTRAFKSEMGDHDLARAGRCSTCTATSTATATAGANSPTAPLHDQMPHRADRASSTSSAVEERDGCAGRAASGSIVRANGPSS